MSEIIFPIKKKDIDEARKKVSTYLSSTTWSPKKVEAGSKSIQSIMISQALSGKFDGSTQTKNILETIKSLSGVENDLMSEFSNYVAHTLLSGLSLAWCTTEQYSKVSGLGDLRNSNLSGLEAIESQKSELQQKLRTESAIFLFTFANYMVRKLSKYNTEIVSARVIPQLSIGELDLIRREKSLQCSLFYYATYLETKELVNDDVSLVRVTLDYFKVLLTEIHQRKDSLQYAEFFSDKTFQVDDKSFTFKGFDFSNSEDVVQIEIKPVRFDEIVGNREIKLEEHRMIQRLVTYDLKTQRNPILDLNGLVRIKMGMGIPGTGKTMLMAASATMAREMCKELKIPFLYAPLSQTIVSKYQGESAERMLEWFRLQNDPTKIIFAPVDDAESVFARRDGDKSSEGNSGVTKVFLTETEGGHVIYRGNTVMSFYTNNWEIMDPAVLSRIQKKTFIKGAQSSNDFMDQAYMWFSLIDKQSPGLVTFNNPKDYEYLADQKMLTKFSVASNIKDIVPQNEKLKDLYHSLTKKYNPEKEPEFFGEFSYGIQKLFPSMWSSRHERNVQSTVSDRLMDFDYPTEWWGDLGKFFATDYDHKKKKLIELRNESMNGLSFATIRLQELVKYADIAVTIDDTAFKKEVEERLKQLKVYDEATRLYEEQKKKPETDKTEKVD